MNGGPSADRGELTRNLIILAWTAPSAALVFLIFHAVYQNLTETAAAVGQIDTATHIGLDMGFLAMVGGTGVLGVIALVAAVRAMRAWSRLRRTP